MMNRNGGERSYEVDSCRWSLKKRKISIPLTYRDDFIVDIDEMAVAMIEVRTDCGETSEEEKREGTDPL